MKRLAILLVLTTLAVNSLQQSRDQLSSRLGDPVALPDKIIFIRVISR